MNVRHTYWRYHSFDAPSIRTTVFILENFMKTLLLSALVATTIIAPMNAFADDDRAEYQAQQVAKIGYDEAEAIAVSAVGGGVVTDIDFELKRGRAYYEVEVVHNNTEYDLKIDANTGKVISKKIDR